MTTKLFVSANQLTADSFALAEKIYSDGFYPTYVIGVLRGGASISVAIHEFFRRLGVPTHYRAIQSTSYTGIEKQDAEISLYGMAAIKKEVQPDEKILLVDDVFDTGRSVDAILKKFDVIHTQQLRVATLWFKPEKNLTDVIPDYYLHKTNQWIVFPHELEGVSMEELAESKPEAANAIKRLQD